MSKTLSGDDIDKHQRVYGDSDKAGADANGDGRRDGLSEDELSEDDLVLTSPIVYGFSLADKLWRTLQNPLFHTHRYLANIPIHPFSTHPVEFNVDHVHTFTWNDEPFENLVLARDQKSLIKSLVEAHIASTSSEAGKGQGQGQGERRVFDDFVEGKGRGLVINLFGNPGVGKSLTSEATSEREWGSSLFFCPCCHDRG